MPALSLCWRTVNRKGLTSDTGLQPDAQALYAINSRTAARPVPDPRHDRGGGEASDHPGPGLTGEGSTGPSQRYADSTPTS